MRRMIAASLIAAAALVVAGVVVGDAGADNDKPKADSQPSLDEQYAQVYLDIVKREFDRATHFNKQVESVLPAPLIASLRESVVVAEGWLAEAKARREGKHYNTYVPWAESLEKVAKDNYQRYLKVKERSPNAVDRGELEDRRLRYELAKLRVARAKALDPNSPIDTMRWQIDQLREEVLQLYNQVVRLTTRE
jgi:hypothetical protein